MIAAASGTIPLAVAKAPALTKFLKCETGDKIVLAICDVAFGYKDGNPVFMVVYADINNKWPWPEVVGVTLGSKGYIILSEEGWIKRPAYSVNTVDTTGCGDIFHAGISYGILKNWNLEKIFDFAAWTAAQVSTQLGGQAGIPKAEDFGKNILPHEKKFEKIF